MSRKVKKQKKDVYRVVLYNDKKLHIVKQLRFTYRAFIVSIITILVVLTAFIFSFVAFTPIKLLIPGYPNAKIRRQIINTALKADSLEKRIKITDRYIRDFKMILAGEDFVDNRVDNDTSIRAIHVEFEDLNHDSIFKEKLEQEQFNLSLSDDDVVKKSISDLLFFIPLKGIVTNTYDISTGHFGVDIVNKMSSRVSSVLDGTVIFEGWTMETGYVIHVQHFHGLISVYKHNAELLKKAGDKVKGGDAIALMGNSGEQTTGPHLHFELWKDGTALNPEDYITF